MQFDKTRDQMDIFEKISCAKFFPEEALEDKDPDVRTAAYRVL